MKNKRILFTAIFLLSSFTAWTLLILVIDTRPIGPNESVVGFATLNWFIHSITGVNFTLYTLTDWLGIIPIVVALSFAFLGLTQWIKRKKLINVDKGLLFLGIFYIAVMLIFVFFEYVVINYRPVLIDGRMEASYPSSTTLLVTTVMPTAIMQWNTRVKNKALKIIIMSVSITFIAFTVICRILSGVHWITDIIGGALLGAGLVTAYYSIMFERNHSNKTK